MKIFHDIKKQTDKLESEWFNLRDKFYFIDDTFCLLAPCHVNVAIESMKAAQEYLVINNLLVMDSETNHSKPLYAMLSQGIMALKLNQTTLGREIYLADSSGIGKSK